GEQGAMRGFTQQGTFVEVFAIGEGAPPLAMAPILDAGERAVLGERGEPTERFAPTGDAAVDVDAAERAIEASADPPRIRQTRPPPRRTATRAIVEDDAQAVGGRLKAHWRHARTPRGRLPRPAPSVDAWPTRPCARRRRCRRGSATSSDADRASRRG